ncbi:MAG: hypothetical protein LBB88_08785 [Planctomycetaceae bacterium]|jgi:hypothetical protein|nr:hypothetical protein [Planctomycetaceae bacterium]
MTNKNILLIIFTLVSTGIMLCGCGHRIPTHVTEVTVTLDGQPVENASVTLVPVNESGMLAVGITDSNGHCRTQTLLGRADGGTVVGEYVITVSKPVLKDSGRKTTDSTTGTVYPEMESVETLPTIYTNNKTSPFRVEVKSGKNSFNADLKK